MMKTIISVPYIELDSIITKTEHLYGKYDKDVLVYNDLSESFDFPMLKREVYIESITKSNGS